MNPFKLSRLLGAPINSMTNRVNAIFLSLALVVSLPLQATVVEVRSSLGDFQINLFDEATPATVANFLSYVNAGSYANMVVHRVDRTFVVQTGGFTYSANTFPPDAIVKQAELINEPVLSNVRGTIAMAKLAGNPNSASSQWFVNMGNNAANLDLQNGGFTVFGQVLGDGMDIVEQIAAVSIFNLGGAFGQLPLRDITTDELQAGAVPDDSNLIIISDIVVIDPTVNSNPDLDPVANTLLNTDNTDSDGGSGGAMSGFLFSMILVFAVRRRCLRVTRA